MAEFDRSSGRVSVSFEEQEKGLLGGLLAELEAVLTEGPGPDPISARLYPKAYEEEEQQRSYEELVGDQLREQKLRIVREVRAGLGGDSLVLDEDSLQSWLIVLTDLRLAIGTRLEVTEEMMGRELDPEDPDAPALSVLHWLGWVQESMLTDLSAT